MTVVSARLEALTNDRLLRRNVALNLVGWALPAAAALVSIPLLAKGLGAARFGLVALSWAAIGLFSIFDLGLGRVITRLVAERLAKGATQDLGDLIWSASWLLLAFTSFLAIGGMMGAPVIVDTWLHVPTELRTEAIGVIRLLAMSIPILAHGVALRGVLEAGQRFGRVNQLRIPLGVASYAGPLLAIPAGADARVAVGIIVLCRVVYWLAHVPFLSDIAPGVSAPRRPRAAATREIIHVGGWITLSSIISPIIVQGDRVAVAIAFPIAVSGWYGAASEVAIKQWLFSAALAPVLFSALSAALATAPNRAVELAERGARVTALALLPAALILVAFAEPGLKLWLGTAYTPDAAPVLRWLTIAVYVNALAHAPYFLLQSGVDARAVALLHMIELPVYLVALFAAVSFGVQGVAIVWCARMSIDAAILWTIVHREMPVARESVGRIARLSLACLVVIALTAAWAAQRG